MVEPHAFEDFEVGASFETDVREVTGEDIAAFAEVSGDFNPLHLDDEYAAERGYGGRIAHGVLGLAVATGLMNGLGLTRGTLIAFLGLEWSFRKPLRPGDAIRVRLEVAGKRRSSTAGRGIVRLAVTLVNERGERVQDGEWAMLVRCRGEEEPAE